MSRTILSQHYLLFAEYILSISGAFQSRYPTTNRKVKTANNAEAFF